MVVAAQLFSADRTRCNEPVQAAWAATTPGWPFGTPPFGAIRGSNKFEILQALLVLMPELNIDQTPRSNH
jgi:hypothetical protein